MCYIKAENINYVKDNEQLLKNFNIEIEKGTLFGVFCENEEVNTAICELLIGSSVPQSGKITVNSFSLPKSREEVRKFTGIVTSGYKLYSYMSAYQNLLFFGNMITDNQKYVPDRASYLMHELKIWSARDKKLSDLDSSTKRRLSLARALIAKPSLLVLDEPFNKLDKGSQETVKAFLKKTAITENITIIICSENAEDLSICDKYTVIKNGENIVTGNVNSLKEYSRLKNKAYIKCDNPDLSQIELNMEQTEKGLFVKELNGDEKVSDIIRSAVLSGADITEAGILEPSLCSICNEIIKIGKKEGESDDKAI